MLDDFDCQHEDLQPTLLLQNSGLDESTVSTVQCDVAGTYLFWRCGDAASPFLPNVHYHPHYTSPIRNTAGENFGAAKTPLVAASGLMARHHAVESRRPARKVHGHFAHPVWISLQRNQHPWLPLVQQALEKNGSTNSTKMIQNTQYATGAEASTDCYFLLSPNGSEGRTERRCDEVRMPCQSANQPSLFGAC